MDELQPIPVTEKTLTQAVEETARQILRNIAVIDSERAHSYSYESLLKDTDSLTRYLVQQTSHHYQYPIERHTGQLIGILSEKGYPQVISTLAIMKSGHGYLPLSLDWPSQRMIEVLTQGQVKFVLISNYLYENEELREALSAHVQLIVVEEIISQTNIAQNRVDSITFPLVQASDIAYVIFTSGSTGRPKGVTISHHGVLNTIQAVNERFKIGRQDKVLALSELSFDLSVYDLFGLLSAGGTIVFPQQSKIKDSTHWIELIHRHHITLWNTVPQFAELLTDELEFTGATANSIRLYLLSGDKIPLNLPTRLHALNDKTTVMSLGGATEGSIWSIWFEVNQINHEWAMIPYGYAMPNQSMYVLTQTGQPAPAGEIGEIHIGGSSVALNYWQDEKRTQESFFEHPQFGRLYATGDLGKNHIQGYIEFIGRKDSQVKIRGFRVELTEIEAIAEEHEHIKSVVAVVKLKNDPASSTQTLVLFYVHEQGMSEEALNQLSAKLKNHLEQQLPYYMVPDVFIPLTELPLTQNGKVDKQVLQQYQLTTQVSHDANLPLEGLEQELQQAWALVLGLETHQVDRHDEFLRLGGDSISCIRLVSRLRYQLQIDINVNEILTHQTIANLAHFIQTKNKQGVTHSSAEQGLLTGACNLLPVQQWFFQQHFSEPSHYQQLFFLKVASLDIDRLQSCLRQLIERHDAFRLQFPSNHMQQYGDGLPEAIPLFTLDIHALLVDENHPNFQAALHQALHEFEQTINIQTGPIFAAGYIHGYGDGSARVCFIIHHLAVDTVSWRILAEDLAQLYTQGSLPPKSDSYRQWVQTVSEYGLRNAQQRSYWAQVMADFTEDFSQKAHQTKIIKIEFSLSINETHALLNQSHDAYHTEINDLLLSALAYALAELDGKPIHHITLEGHGREMIDSSIDIANTMGWFTSVFPVRLVRQLDLGATIVAVKEMLRAIPDKGIGYGILMGYAQALPKITFNYLGQFVSTTATKDNLTFALTNEGKVLSSSAKNLNHALITLTGMVIENQAFFQVESYLNEAEAKQFSEQFQRYLQQIIIHTSTQKIHRLTVSDAHYLVTEGHLNVIQEKSAIKAILLANSLQQGFIYHAVAQGANDDAYHVQFWLNYASAINPHLLKQAWALMIQRYDALRLCFAWEEQPIQIVNAEVIFDWCEKDISAWDTNTQAQLLMQYQGQDREARFNLQQAPLFRVCLFKRSTDHFTCLFSMHHAILDGWSCLVLLKALHHTYMDLLDSKTPHPIQDESYRAAQVYIHLHREDHDDFWTNEINRYRNDTQGLSQLVKGSSGEIVDTRSYKHVLHSADQVFCIYGSEFQQLKQLCRAHQVTLNALLTYVWHHVLHVYTVDQQTVVGITVSGRQLPIKDIEHAVGLFINTLPLMLDWSALSKESVMTGVRLVQEKINQLNSCAVTPLSRIQRKGHRLFDNLFVYNHFSDIADPDIQEKLNVHIATPIETLDYPLVLNIEENLDGLSFIFKYASELFKVELIQGLFATMTGVLQQIVAAPSQICSALIYVQLDSLATKNVMSSLRDISEVEEISRDVRDGEYVQDGESFLTVHTAFENCARKYPSHIAVESTSMKLSYQALNERANRLANYLMSLQKLRPETLIMVCMDDPLEQVVATLAILKSGAAYVPMSPTMPDERLQYVISDANIQWIVTTQALLARFQRLCNSDTALIAVNAPSTAQKIVDCATTNPSLEINISRLAYVMYTSGTTGKPKGVLVEHHGIVSLVTHVDYLSVNNKDTFVQLSDVGFDASTFEIWGALLNGARLMLIDDRKSLLADADAFMFFLKQHSVTLLWLTKSLFDEIYRLHHDAFNDLRYLIVGGEALNYNLMKKLVSQPCRPHHILNGYGPTENTTFSCIYELQLPDLEKYPSVPIGSAFAHRYAVAFTEHFQQVPKGAVGELWVGGEGLARGYLNQPDLTAQRFRIDPQGYRWYRTGDFVLRLLNDQFLYLGRRDRQIKIRGYRVELQEIEKYMTAFAGIQQCAVLLKENQNHHAQLVAYYVSTSSIDLQLLRQYLQTHCPDHMIPAAFVALSALPLTSNGKIDEAALPEVMLTAIEKSTEALNASQQTIQAIWSSILGVKPEQIGLYDNFFLLGGDSILCIQLASRLKQTFKKEIRLNDLFRLNTIAALADYFAESQSPVKKTISMESDEVMGEVPLLPIQQWFFQLNLKNIHHWNQAFLIKTPALNIQELQSSIKALIQYHDAFRLRFQQDEHHQFKQFYVEHPGEIVFKIIHYQEVEDLQHELTTLQANFNITNGPIACFAYIHGFADGSARIFIAAHHLIIDAVSWRILANDLASLYKGEALLPKGSSYAAWVRAVQHYSQSHSEEMQYWHEVMSNFEDTFINNKVETNHQETLFKLPIESTEALLRQSHQAFHTRINDLLLTALAYALLELTGKASHHIVLEGHGREDIDDAIDIQQTMGWFTTIYPVRLSIAETLAKTIQTIKLNLQQVPKHGLGYGILKGYETQLPKVSFNYLGQLSQENQNWSITNEPAGEMIANQQSHLLMDINGFVMDKQLQFSVKTKLNLSAHQQFCAAFELQLQEIIDYCCQKNAKDEVDFDFGRIQSEQDIDQLPTIPMPKEGEWFEMTEIQKAYLLGRLGNYEIGNTSNHIYYEFYYPTLEVERLELALRDLIVHYPVMRTVFSFELMQQKNLKADEIHLYTLEHQHFPHSYSDSALASIRSALSQKVYQPDRFPLFDFCVSTFTDCAVLHISIDLILLDAESRLLLFALLHQLYQGNRSVLIHQPTSFQYYQCYYQMLRKSAWYERDKAYWQKKLPHMPLRAELPMRVAPQTIGKPHFADHTLFIPAETWKKFKEKLVHHQISSASGLLSLYGAVLAFFSGRKELLITMTLFNRYSLCEDVQQIMGDFTSTNLFHFTHFGRHIHQTIEHTHQTLWEDINHALYTGVEVQRDLAKWHELNENQAVSPLVFTGVLGARRSFEKEPFLQADEMRTKRYWCGQTSQAWIDLQAIEDGEQLMSKWIYVEQLFEPNYIAQLNQCFCQLIDHIAYSSWNTHTDWLPWSAQYLQVAKNQQPNPEMSICEAIATSIHSQNAYLNTAVIEASTDKQYDYATILSEADYLAKYLTHRGQQDSNPLIAILSEKGYSQVISTLAIMQAGRGYLPLNVDWPVNRLIEVLEQAQVNTILISNSQCADRVKHEALSAQFNLIIIDDLLTEIRTDTTWLSQLEAIDLDKINPDSIAYVIFTSGSTGHPKGVTISHRGALNTILAVNQRFHVNGADKVLALSELSFDLSVYDLFGLLIAGGTIVIPNQQETKESQHWVDVISRYGITLWNTVPQLADLLADALETNIVDSKQLRLFLLSGDKIPLTLPPRLQALNPNATIMSLGGATEGSIWSIWYEVNAIDSSWALIPYGNSMPNQSIYVLNEDKDLTPVTVMGEIYIGGVGVALNYWRDPERTQGSFITHPQLGYLYRTGDLGRWHKDGYVEFIGRKDNQVKIRGYRVELGEVERKLLCAPGIKNATVGLIGNTELTKTLIAYVIPESAISATTKAQHVDFKLKQIGDRRFDTSRFTFDLPKQSFEIAETKAYHRKSYRQFSGRKLSWNRLTAALGRKKLAQSESSLTLMNLSMGLAAFYGHTHDVFDLPKYRYPSGGSLYSVQVYLRLVMPTESGILSGYYYYDRRAHRLVLMSMLPTESATAIEVYFVANCSAIEPIYAGASSELYYLEVGYMYGLLNQSFPLQWAKENAYEDLTLPLGLTDDHYQLLARVKGLQPPQAALMTVQDKQVNCFMYIKAGALGNTKGEWYQIKADQLLKMDFAPLPDLIHYSDNELIWRQSSFAVYWVAQSQDKNPDALIEAGTYAQRLCEAMLVEEIGACPMGEVHSLHQPYLNQFFSDRAILHHCVFGPLSHTQMQEKGHSTIDRLHCHRQETLSYLATTLPDYMIPTDLLYLDEFPLSANGKIDHKALLLLTDNSNQAPQLNLTPPSSGPEKAIAQLWSEILELPLDMIGIQSNFFRLGGNSLLAMQFVSRVNSELGFSLKLKDVYELGELERIAECGQVLMSESEREIGEL